MKKETDNIKKLIEEVITLKDKVKDLKNENVSISATVLLVKNEIRKELKELKETKDERKKIEKSNKLLKTQEDSFIAREKRLVSEEKRIKRMGKTLQKHFTQNDMGHIRVFEE